METKESDALHQLQSQQSELLDVIDELKTIGLGRLVELPQLIVCGNQSSGKSSVLEAISRVRFPAKSSVCTRFATEVILRRSPSPSVKISIEPGPSRTNEQERRKLSEFPPEELQNSNDLPLLVEKAKECMGITDSTNAGFSDDVLKVEISGPDKPGLALVDLPGLYYSTSREQGSEGISIVRNLVEKYMENTRSIILAVITAKSDYHLQEVLNIAERFDPRRERTLAILTQPDVLEVNSEEEDNYLQFVRNEKIRLQLGWHALRNRSFESRDASDDARDEKEKAFFNSGTWATISREFVGIDSLRRRLSGVLLKHIKHSLPSLIDDINDKIADRQTRLEKLGDSRSNLREQKEYILKLSRTFERLTGQALDGMYRDDFFGGLDAPSDVQDPRRLRAVIKNLNEDFFEAMETRGCRRRFLAAARGLEDTPVHGSGNVSNNPYLREWTLIEIDRAALEEELVRLSRQHRGMELPGTVNQLLVGHLFRDQSQPWEEIAKTHVLTVWESVRHFIELLLQHLTDDHTFPLLMSDFFDLELERIKDNLVDKVKELNAYNRRGHPLPFGPKFVASLQELRAKQVASATKPSNPTNSSDNTANYVETTSQSKDLNDECTGDQLAVKEIIDLMQAYYNITMSTFIDNVAILAIENCLLLPLESIFTSLAVNNMSDERIKFYGSEAPFIQADRERLRGELDKLQAGLRACSRYNRAALGVRHALKPGTPVERKSSTESRVTVKLPTETARSSIPAQGGTANAVGANGIPSSNIEAQKPRRAKHAKEFSDKAQGLSSAEQKNPASAAALSSDKSSTLTNTNSPFRSSPSLERDTPAVRGNESTNPVTGLGSSNPATDQAPSLSNATPTPNLTSSFGRLNNPPDPATPLTSSTTTKPAGRSSLFGGVSASSPSPTPFSSATTKPEGLGGIFGRPPVSSPSPTPLSSTVGFGGSTFFGGGSVSSPSPTPPASNPKPAFGGSTPLFGQAAGRNAPSFGSLSTSGAESTQYASSWTSKSTPRDTSSPFPGTKNQAL